MSVSQINLDLTTPKGAGILAAVCAVVLVLLILAIVYGVQANGSSSPHTAGAIGLPLVGGTGALINVQDTNPDTVGFTGTAYALNGSSGTVSSNPYVPNSGTSNPSTGVFSGEVSFSNLAPNTSYRAVLQSVNGSGSPTKSAPVQVQFTTGPAPMPNPVTNLKLVVGTAVPGFNGWSRVLVYFDTLPSLSYNMVVNSPAFGLTFTGPNVGSNYSNGGVLQVPSGVPVTVSVTALAGPQINPSYQVGEALTWQSQASVQTIAVPLPAGGAYTFVSSAQ
jgi:hypothetical protein